MRKDFKDGVVSVGLLSEPRIGVMFLMGLHPLVPGHTPCTRFACARPFRFAKGGDSSLCSE